MSPRTELRENQLAIFGHLAAAAGEARHVAVAGSGLAGRQLADDVERLARGRWRRRSAANISEQALK